jgi:hypothetical protein
MTAEPFTVNFSFDERRLRTALRSLRDAEALALKAGAAKADEVSRSGFRYRRPSAPPRAGRSSTQGKMTEHVDWKVERGAVRLDVKKLDRAAQYVRTVKSQKGRKISASLAFGTSPGGQFVPAGAGRGQQLYRRRDLTGSPFRPRRITIRNEIHGQHFVRDGARAGYREYRRTMLGAARRTFAGQKSRP